MRTHKPGRTASQRTTHARATRQTPRGFVFITVLLTVTFLALFAMVGTQRTATNQMAARRFAATQQAFFLAEGGLDQTITWLRTKPTFPSQTRFYPFCQPMTADCGSVPLQVGTYAVNITQDQPSPGYATVAGTGTATDTGASASLSLVIKSVSKKSFATFLVYQDKPTPIDPPGTWLAVPWHPIDAQTYFHTGQSLDGPVHMNSYLLIWGDPAFLAKTSTASFISCAHGCPPYDPFWPNPPNPDHPFFAQPPRTGADGVTPIPIPNAAATMSDLLSHASLVLPDAMHIRFNGDKLVLTDDFGTSQTVPVPNNGVVYVAGTAKLDGGTLQGKLTVAANGDIQIADSVRYDCDPRQPNSVPCVAAGDLNRDMLGLVAQHSVILPHGAPQDITIHATMMTLTGALQAEDCCQNADGSKVLKGKVHIFGGTITEQHGILGMLDLDTGQMWSGYTFGAQQYDPRFAQVTPPYFPAFKSDQGGAGDGEYEPVMWQGQ